MTITVTFTGSDLADIKGQINGFMGVPKPMTTLPARTEEAPAKVEVVEKTVEQEPEVVDDGIKADAPIPYETVRDAVLRLALAKGKPRVMELLNEFGAQKKADEIDPARYAEVLETINKIMEA